MPSSKRKLSGVNREKRQESLAWHARHNRGCRSIVLGRGSGTSRYFREGSMMATTYMNTIAVSSGATVGPLFAVAFIQISNLGPDDQMIVSWVGSAPNSIEVFGSVTVDPVENNTGLWPLMNNSGLTILGQIGQRFSIYYG
jgi:hypothetical protein